MKGRDVCFFHVPKSDVEIEKIKNRARKNGGLVHRSIAKLGPEVIQAMAKAPKNVHEVCDLLSMMVAQVAAGGEAMSPRTASQLAYVCSQLVKAQESAQLGDRLARIEDLLGAGPRTIDLEEPHQQRAT